MTELDPYAAYVEQLAYTAVLEDELGLVADSALRLLRALVSPMKRHDLNAAIAHLAKVLKKHKPETPTRDSADDAGTSAPGETGEATRGGGRVAALPKRNDPEVPDQ